MAVAQVILDLCGGSGSWSKSYADAGYQVINVTLPTLDVMTFAPPANVHGILAAPPCTHFSLARTRAKTPRDLKSAMETVEACLKIIWQCRLNGGLKWWALENPVGFLRQFLGRPAMTFKPCEYGDWSTKVTDLWGYFTLPRKLRNPVPVPKGRNGANYAYDNTRSPALRAVTPPCFARAFYEANQ